MAKKAIAPDFASPYIGGMPRDHEHIPGDAGRSDPSEIQDADDPTVERLAKRLQFVMERSDPCDPPEVWETLPEFRRQRLRHWVCDLLIEISTS